jgi:hypothetical protein
MVDAIPSLFDPIFINMRERLAFLRVFCPLDEVVA